MTPDQISKLPPELRPIAELCAEVRDATRCACCSSPTIEKVMACGSAFCFHCLENRTRHDGCETCEARSAALPLALTWGLQVVEERDGEIALNKAHEATIAQLEQEAADDALVFEHAQEVSGKQEATIATLTRERDDLVKQLSRIAETVATLPSITGLQTGCVKDHSLIWMAIRDAQDAYRDTLKRHQREAQQHAKRAETAEAEVTRLRDELEREQRIIGLPHTPEGEGK